MGAFTTTETIWFNGTFVPWAGAQAHVLAHGGRIALLDGPEGGTILRIELPAEE